MWKSDRAGAVFASGGNWRNQCILDPRTDTLILAAVIVAVEFESLVKTVLHRVLDYPSTNAGRNTPTKAVPVWPPFFGGIPSSINAGQRDVFAKRHRAEHA